MPGWKSQTRAPSSARRASCSSAISRKSATYSRRSRCIEYLARRTGVAEAERELDRLTRELAENPDAVDAYTEALDRFLALGGSDLDARARAACAELGLAARLDRPVAGLSGGEAGRAALASILLARFDVFLLDEPTNDLDADGLERLERHLTALPGGVVVISHDRAFLDAMVDRIAAIEPRGHRLREWAGGWSEYAGRRDTERRGAYTAFEQSQERRREVSALLAQRRTEARAGGAKADRRGTHALMTKVRQAERALGRVDGPAKPFEPWELHLALRAGRRPGDIVCGATRRRRLTRRLPARAGRPGHRLAANGSSSPGPTAPASRPSSPRCSASCRSRPAAASSAARP